MKHILIVDDDLALAEMLKALLESHDFLVSVAPDGVEALKTLMNLDVDVILCDLMMPKMAGDMFFLAVQRVKPHLCAKFVFITAYEGHPRFEEFLRRVKGVVLYKPVTEGKLLGTLKIIFSRPAASAVRSGALPSGV